MSFKIIVTSLKEVFEAIYYVISMGGFLGKWYSRTCEFVHRKMLGFFLVTFKKPYLKFL